MLYRNSNIKTKAIQYGIENEKVAIEKFETLLNIKVKNCRFFVTKDYCFLGASPDGITQDNKLVEVKCFYSVRNQKIKDAVESNKRSYLKLISDGELCLKQNHYYYY